MWEKKMSWADKQLQKHKIHKMVEDAMKDSRVQEIRKQELDDATARAFDCFLIISVDYLWRNHRYGKAGVMKFLKHVTEQMEYAKEYDDYFVTMNEAIRDEIGVDVLKNEIVEKGDKANEVKRD